VFGQLLFRRSCLGPRRGFRSRQLNAAFVGFVAGLCGTLQCLTRVRQASFAFGDAGRCGLVSRLSFIGSSVERISAAGQTGEICRAGLDARDCLTFEFRCRDRGGGVFAGQRMFRGSAGRERFACQPLFERSGLGEKLFDGQALFERALLRCCQRCSELSRRYACGGGERLAIALFHARTAPWDQERQVALGGLRFPNCTRRKFSFERRTSGQIFSAAYAFALLITK
jgi:hypothetical protein